MLAFLGPFAPEITAGNQAGIPELSIAQAAKKLSLIYELGSGHSVRKEMQRKEKSPLFRRLFLEC